MIARVVVAKSAACGVRSVRCVRLCIAPCSIHVWSIVSSMVLWIPFCLTFAAVLVGCGGFDLRCAVLVRACSLGVPC